MKTFLVALAIVVASASSAMAFGPDHRFGMMNPQIQQSRQAYVSSCYVGGHFTNTDECVSNWRTFQVLRDQSIPTVYAGPRFQHRGQMMHHRMMNHRMGGYGQYYGPRW